MVKLLIGVLAALVIAVGRLFRFRILRAAAGRRPRSRPHSRHVRASGAKATHGKVAFDLWSRTITVADIAGELAAAAAGQRQDRPVHRRGREPAGAPGASPPTGSRPPTSRSPEPSAAQAGLRAHLSGAAHRGRRLCRARPARCGGSIRAAAADIYRFALEHFAAVTATSVTAPTVAVKFAPAGASRRRAPATTPIRASRCATSRTARSPRSTVERVVLHAPTMTRGGKTENLTGEVADLAAYDFDAAATLVDARSGAREGRQILPRLSADDRRRLHGDVPAGPEDAHRWHDRRRCRPAALAAAIPATDGNRSRPRRRPAPRRRPSRCATCLDKVAGIYEGIRIGGAEMRGLSMDTPRAPFKLAAIRLANLENGKIAEFALEGLEAQSPQGPVKIGRFALKALDIANLMRAVGAVLARRARSPRPNSLPPCCCCSKAPRSPIWSRPTRTPASRSTSTR